jgi:hypothetical protein
MPKLQKKGIQANQGASKATWYIETGEMRILPVIQSI